MKRALHLLARSFVENERLSPRLLTVFAFVGAALLLIWRGATTPAHVEGGIILTAWPPEYIWSGLMLTIAGLLGLGKVVESWQRVKLEGPPEAPQIDQSTTIKADTAPVSADTVNVNTAPGP